MAAQGTLGNFQANLQPFVEVEGIQLGKGCKAGPPARAPHVITALRLFVVSSYIDARNQHTTEIGFQVMFINAHLQCDKQVTSQPTVIDAVCRSCFRHRLCNVTWTQSTRQIWSSSNIKIQQQCDIILTVALCHRGAVAAAGSCGGRGPSGEGGCRDSCGRATSRGGSSAPHTCSLGMLCSLSCVHFAINGPQAQHVPCTSCFLM